MKDKAFSRTMCALFLLVAVSSLANCGGSSSKGQTPPPNQTPTITSISPTSIAAGSPQAFLTINGSNLIQQTQAQFSITPGTVVGSLVTFNFISTNQIVVALPASVLQNPQTI